MDALRPIYLDLIDSLIKKIKSKSIYTNNQITRNTPISLSIFVNRDGVSTDSLRISLIAT